SPINKTVEMGMINNSLVITGNEDPLITRENVNQISDLSGVKLIRIDGANHALNIEGDAVKSLEVQLNIIKCIKKYLKSI
ncbi:MAG: alpha/beta hydrolase, partial [Clostridium baratii]|nr:alpha/beta hydrolase [Clostridium baratii]